MDAYLADLYDDGQVTVTGLAVLSVVFTIFWTCLDFGCLAVKGLFRSVGVDAGERRQRLFFLSSIHAIVVTAFSGCVRVRHGCGACHCVQTRAAGLCELGLLRRALVSRARGTGWDCDCGTRHVWCSRHEFVVASASYGLLYDRACVPAGGRTIGTSFWLLTAMISSATVSSARSRWVTSSTIGLGAPSSGSSTCPRCVSVGGRVGGRGTCLMGQTTRPAPHGVPCTWWLTHVDVPATWPTDCLQFTHHVLAIGVTVAVLCTPAVTMFVPAFLVVEGSTVFYNIAWFLKKNGQEHHPATLVVMLFFTVSFFLLRVVWMPYATYDVMVLNTERWHQMVSPWHPLSLLCTRQQRRELTTLLACPALSGSRAGSVQVCTGACCATHARPSLLCVVLWMLYAPCRPAVGGQGSMHSGSDSA